MYTFDASEAEAMETYHAVCEAYERLFSRLGVASLKGEIYVRASWHIVCKSNC